MRRSTEVPCAHRFVLNKFNDRGFTFITVDPEHGIKEDVFLHISGIEDPVQANLFIRGARIEFEMMIVSRGGRDRPQARNARLSDRKR